MMFPSMTEKAKAAMLQFVDIENWEDLFTAQVENGKAMIDEALRNNAYTPPSPFMDLQQFIIDANQAEQRAERMKVPEQNLSTLRRMIRRANELRQRQQLAAQMQNAGAITPAAVPNDGSGQPPTSVEQPQQPQAITQTG
jgi:hypothetical protein